MLHISNVILDRRSGCDLLSGLSDWDQNLSFSEHGHVAF